MYNSGYGLFLSEGQYDDRRNTFTGFSPNKEELEEEIKKLENDFELFENEFKIQEINIDYYIGRFNNDWNQYFTDNVRSLFKETLDLPNNKPVTKVEHKEWCRIKDVNNRAEKFNSDLKFVKINNFLINWMIENPPENIEKFIVINGTSIRKIFIGSCPEYFVVEMNESF
jgi:hypothetical protein